MSELLPGGYSLSFSVDSETADQRIDRTVADAFPELSRSRIQHMAENGWHIHRFTGWWQAHSEGLQAAVPCPHRSSSKV